MTVYRTITPDGKFLYYMVRLQREGRKGYIYSQDMAEIKKAIHKHWETCDLRFQPTYRRKIEITDRILYGSRARKWARDNNAPTVERKTQAVEVNGCWIVPARGRCATAWKCANINNCLAIAQTWPGWRKVGEDDRNHV